MNKKYSSKLKIGKIYNRYTFFCEYYMESGIQPSSCLKNFDEPCRKCIIFKEALEKLKKNDKNVKNADLDVRSDYISKYSKIEVI